MPAVRKTLLDTTYVSLQFCWRSSIVFADRGAWSLPTMIDPLGLHRCAGEYRLARPLLNSGQTLALGKHTTQPCTVQRTLWCRLHFSDERPRQPHSAEKDRNRERACHTGTSICHTSTGRSTGRHRQGLAALERCCEHPVSSLASRCNIRAESGPTCLFWTMAAQCKRLAGLILRCAMYTQQGPSEARLCPRSCGSESRRARPKAQGPKSPVEWRPLRSGQV